MDRGLENRWLVLAADGRHVTLGRHRAPDEAELVRAAEELDRQGVVAWFARMTGGYYERAVPRVERIRQLTGGEADWEAAVAAFERKRRAALG
jgi:hypothetical protein